MKSLFRFWNELRRRNVPKGVISYVIFSWVILQVISVLGSLVEVPKWAGKSLLITLLIFFPIWLIFIWFYDITSDGIKKTARLEGDIDEDHTATVGKRLNAFILVFLGLAVVLLFVDRMRLTSEKAETETTNTIVNAPNSIAVLPFKDISLLKDQTYFADGLAEELINALSRISDMRVTSRTSAFSFKDQTVDIPTIAAKLGVNYILEGSVRTEDSILRVNVKLIDTRDDSYAWSQSWDKKIENIFQIQNEISTTVAQKLEIEITDDEITNAKKVDPEAYKLLLQARYEVNTIGGSEATLNASKMVKRSLEIDSTYAPSWELLSSIYHQLNNHGLLSIEDGYPLAKEAALRALKMDSTYVDTFGTLATIAIDYERDYKKADSLVKKGLTREPQNPNLLDRASEVAQIFGDFEKALEYNLRISVLNPLDDYALSALGNTYYFTKQYREAEEAFKKSIRLNPNSQISYHSLSVSLLFQDRLKEALEAGKKEKNEGLRLHGLSMVYYALGDLEKANFYLNELIQKYEESYSYQVALTYAFHENKEMAFKWLDKAIYYQDFGLMEADLDPILDAYKEDPRWTDFRQRLGFLSSKD